MLTKEQKKNWIKALRSGNYNQGKDYLCKDNKYCCLGVLAEECFSEYFELDPDNGWKVFNNGGSGKMINILPLDILTIDYIRAALVRMNDTENKSFNEIADWIELNIPTKEDFSC